jgi:integrase
MARWRKINGVYWVYERLTLGSRKETCERAGPFKNKMWDLKLDMENRKAILKRYNVDPDSTVWGCADQYYALPRKREASSLRMIGDAIRNVKEFFKPKEKIADVVESRIEAFLKWMERKEYANASNPNIVKRYTRNGIIRKMRTVRAIFKMAKDKKIIDQNPTIKPIKDYGGPTPVARFLSDEEVSILLFHAGHQKKRGGGYYPLKGYALPKIIRNALQTGLRAGDVLNLCKEDRIETTDGPQVQIRKKIAMNPTKPREDFMIPIPNEILPHFDAIPSGPLYPAWSVKQLDHNFRQAAIRAGLYTPKNPLRFHDLRHTFAKNYLQRVEKANCGSLSRLLHHADVSTTIKWYGKYERSYLKEQVDQIIYKIDAGPPLLKVV